MQVPTWKGESGRERWGPEGAGWDRAGQEGSVENHAGPLVPLPLSSPAGYFPHSAGPDSPEEEGKDLVLFSKLNSALSNQDKRERSTWRNHFTPCPPLCLALLGCLDPYHNHPIQDAFTVRRSLPKPGRSLQQIRTATVRKMCLPSAKISSSSSTRNSSGSGDCMLWRVVPERRAGGPSSSPGSQLPHCPGWFPSPVA